MQIECPHCRAVNPPGAQFCGACGKALPSAEHGGPRVLTPQDLASIKAGQQLQSEELARQVKKASGALLAVAVLQTFFGAVLLLMNQGGASAIRNIPLTPAAFIGIFGVGILFFGLYLWARRSPFPAAICGLVIFVTVHALDALADPRTILQGILVKIIVIVVLARAVSAGVKHRQLMRNAELNG